MVFGLTSLSLACFGLPTASQSQSQSQFQSPLTRANLFLPAGSCGIRTPRNLTSHFATAAKKPPASRTSGLGHLRLSYFADLYTKAAPTASAPQSSSMNSCSKRASFPSVGASSNVAGAAADDADASSSTEGSWAETPISYGTSADGMSSTSSASYCA